MSSIEPCSISTEQKIVQPSPLYAARLFTRSAAQNINPQKPKKDAEDRNCKSHPKPGARCLNISIVAFVNGQHNTIVEVL